MSAQISNGTPAAAADDENDNHERPAKAQGCGQRCLRNPFCKNSIKVCTRPVPIDYTFKGICIMSALFVLLFSVLLTILFVYDDYDHFADTKKVVGLTSPYTFTVPAANLTELVKGKKNNNVTLIYTLESFRQTKFYSQKKTTLGLCPTIDDIWSQAGQGITLEKMVWNDSVIVTQGGTGITCDESTSDPYFKPGKCAKPDFAYRFNNWIKMEPGNKVSNPICTFPVDPKKDLTLEFTKNWGYYDNPDNLLPDLKKVGIKVVPPSVFGGDVSSLKLLTEICLGLFFIITVVASVGTCCNRTQ